MFVFSSKGRAMRQAFGWTGIFHLKKKTVQVLKSPNESSIVPLCYKFKNKSKGTPRILVAQDRHIKHHGNIFNAPVILFPWLPKHQDLQKPFPKPASQLNKTLAVTGLQLTAWNGVQLERTKIGKAFLPLQLLHMNHVRHTFEFVVFRVCWEERVWKKFGESEASILGSVLNVVPYCWLQLLHEFWTGCSQLLNNFIPLINIWTPVVKGNKMQTPI